MDVTRIKTVVPIALSFCLAVPSVGIGQSEFQSPDVKISVNSPRQQAINIIGPPGTTVVGAPGVGHLVDEALPREHSTFRSPGTSMLPGTTRGRASGECDATPWMSPYLQRALGNLENADASGDFRPIPPRFVPWWDDQVRKPLNKDALKVNVDWLLQSTLQNSPVVRAISAEPHIRRSSLVEESAEFDWRSFLETTYDDLNDPVGNTLTTGSNDDRFKDRIWSGSGGVRRRTATGGELEISQQVGRQRNNSIFLLPNPQSTTRLALNYTQPLLSGSGRPYNLSRIVLARIDRNIANDAVVEKLQEQLLQVTEAYWEIYRTRARFFQRQKLLEDAVKIAESLADRERVDALYRQTLRARAAVARRRSEITRAATEIRNSESQLRLLVNDPALKNISPGQLTPLDVPSRIEVPLSMSDSLTTALAHRPDISKAIRSMRSTTVRLGVARNEILPRLDFLVNTYVAGLEGKGQVFKAWGDQLSEGRPGFTVGLQFEVPLGNRAANARYNRRRWELYRAVNQFQATVENALTEVELAVREVSTAYREMIAKYQSMITAQEETEYLTDRFKTLPGANSTATALLVDLLESQERLADEETAFVDAQVKYSVSLIKLRRSMGTLLTCDSGAPHVNVAGSEQEVTVAKAPDER